MPNHGEGPIPARIMLVGEAWGEYEERAGVPFVGPSGQELNRMLHEAGIMRSECFTTNLVNRRPPNNDMGEWIALKKNQRTPEHKLFRDKYVKQVVLDGYNQLLAEIEMCQPTLIIAFGNWAMWALTGQFGILKWRGSQLTEIRERKTKVIPTLHPANILRDWSMRAAVITDLRRAARNIEGREYNRPAWNFILRPSFERTMETIGMLQFKVNVDDPLWLDLDLETSRGHIACCGLSWSKVDAICIPFMTTDNKEGYWSLEEETHIIFALYKLLLHPGIRVRWQNGLYDAQYIHRWWHFIPRGGQDTMISQHSIFSDLPKALAFQASLYADHYVYWKDEGKNWNPSMGEEQHWNYNCLDCVYTREVGEVEIETAKKLGLEKVHAAQQEMFWPVLRAMLRGVRVIEDNAGRLAAEVFEQIEVREKLLLEILGFPVNISSPKQMIELFFGILNQPTIMTRAKKGYPAHPTCDDEALQKIGRREPLLLPLVNCVADLRTLKKFLKDFIMAKRDTDGRMRCSYNIGGSESGASAPKTYRLSSSKNPFNSGMNLQTIPSEKSKSVGKWEQRQHFASIGDPYSLPNLRSMFGPDSGYTFFDMDLDRADLQVMAWDAGDPLLKAALKQKVDVHLLNVYVLDGKDPPPLEELVEGHPKYLDHRGPRKHKREFAKVFCHATDYLGKSRTVAANTGRTVHEIDRAQKLYLGTYKSIKLWQDSVIEQVRRHQFVENKFGYRWYIFDRIDDQVMPEAVAWIPQSTVSIIINRIWLNIHKNLPEVEVLLQVHDSLGGQFPSHRKARLLPAMLEQSRITVPYDDPLIIPTSIGTSEISWGDC